MTEKNSALEESTQTIATWRCNRQPLAKIRLLFKDKKMQSYDSLVERVHQVPGSNCTWESGKGQVRTWK